MNKFQMDNTYRQRLAFFLLGVDLEDQKQRNGLAYSLLGVESEEQEEQIQTILTGNNKAIKKYLYEKIEKDEKPMDSFGSGQADPESAANDEEVSAGQEEAPSGENKKDYHVVVLDRIPKKYIWGLGESQEEAYADAFQNLRDSWEMNCWPCTKGLFDFVNKHGGSEAIDNAFVSCDEFYDLMPSHDALYDFCEKYKISENAKEELKNLLDFPINFTGSVTYRVDIDDEE